MSTTDELHERADVPEREEHDADAGRTSPLRHVTSWWRTMLFTEESTASLAVIRVLSGLVILGWAITVNADVVDFFGPDAVAPWGSTDEGRWSLLEWFGSASAVRWIHAALIVGCLAMIVGWHTRIASAVVLVALMAFGRRNPWVVNSGDLLLRHLAFYAMLAPGGVALSVAAWRKHGSPWVFPHRAAWPRRLLQVQLSIIYISTALAKAEGTTWHDGTAVGFALRIEDLVRFALPEFVLDSVLLVNVMTLGTLALEFALGVLIWNRRLRPWLLGAGVLLHLFIDLTLTVGFFSYGMLVLYVSFIEPDTTERVLHRVRRRLGARQVAAPT